MVCKVISASEVRKHTGPGSVWIIIHNNVYDVTKYIDEHPGGVDAIMEKAGQDATQAFEDVGHSDDAREVLAGFKIGTLPINEKTSVPMASTTSSSKPDRRQSISPCEGRRVQSVVVPRESGKWKWAALALAGALLVGIVLKKYLS